MVRVSRGLTLIEILIALGLVVALAALVLPTLSWMSRFRPLDSACQDVEALCLRARAHAAVNGRPIQIRVRGSNLEADWLEIEALSFDAADSIEAVDELNDSDVSSETSDPLPTWSRLRLQDGVRCLARSSFVSETVDESSAMSDVMSDSSPLGESIDRTTLLVIFLPDGTAISRDDLVLVDDSGRTRNLMIDELTGRVTTIDSVGIPSENEDPLDRLEESPRPESDRPRGEDLETTEGGVDV